MRKISNIGRTDNMDRLWSCRAKILQTDYIPIISG